MLVRDVCFLKRAKRDDIAQIDVLSERFPEPTVRFFAVPRRLLGDKVASYYQWYVKVEDSIEIFSNYAPCLIRLVGESQDDLNRPFFEIDADGSGLEALECRCLSRYVVYAGFLLNCYTSTYGLVIISIDEIVPRASLKG